MREFVSLSSRQRPRTRVHVPLLVLFGLALTFWMFTVVETVSSPYLSDWSITSVTAHFIWIVRDLEKIETAVPGDMAGVILRNFGTMLGRASPFELVVAIPLDILTTLTGELHVTVWIGVSLLALPGAALICRSLRRFRPVVPFLVLLLTGFIYLQLLSPRVIFSGQLLLGELVEAYNRIRLPHELTIAVYTEDSTLGYLEAQGHLSPSLHIGAEWLSFSAEEIDRIVAGWGGGTIWMILDGSDPTMSAVADELEDALERSGWNRSGGYFLGTYLGEYIIAYHFSPR